MQFQYRADLLEQYPDICGGVLWATELRNGPSSPALQSEYFAEQEAVRARLPDQISALASLAAWRQAFRRFGTNPTKYRSAAEALLRRLQKKGAIPSINCLVDIGNLVSIRYGLPVAIFDTRRVTGAITVHPAAGDECFIELDNAKIVHPDPGEVVFSDDTGMVVARRWCWRQSAESAARLDTTAALITVEAHHAGGHEDVHSAVADLTRLLAQHANGQTVDDVLDADKPVFIS